MKYHSKLNSLGAISLIALAVTGCSKEQPSNSSRITISVPFFSNTGSATDSSAAYTRDKIVRSKTLQRSIALQVSNDSGIMYPSTGLYPELYVPGGPAANAGFEVPMACRPPDGSNLQNYVQPTECHNSSQDGQGSNEGEDSLLKSPRTLSDFNCFAINVVGPGLPLDERMSCGNPDEAMGKFVGFVRPGTDIEIEVPGGPHRKFQLIGVVSEEGCPNFDQVMSRPKEERFRRLDYPTLLAEKITDIKRDSSAVELKVSFDPNHPREIFKSCRAADENIEERQFNRGPENFVPLVAAVKGEVVGDSLNQAPPTGSLSDLGPLSNASVVTGAELASVFKGTSPYSAAGQGFLTGAGTTGYRAAVELRFDVTDAKAAGFNHLRIGAMIGVGPSRCQFQAREAHASEGVYTAIYLGAQNRWIPLRRFARGASSQEQNYGDGGSDLSAFTLSDLALTVEGRKLVYFRVESETPHSGNCQSKLEIVGLQSSAHQGLGNVNPYYEPFIVGGMPYVYWSSGSPSLLKKGYNVLENSPFRISQSGSAQATFSLNSTQLPNGQDTAPAAGSYRTYQVTEHNLSHELEVQSVTSTTAVRVVMGTATGNLPSTLVAGTAYNLKAETKTLTGGLPTDGSISAQAISSAVSGHPSFNGGSTSTLVGFGTSATYYEYFGFAFTSALNNYSNIGFLPGYIGPQALEVQGTGAIVRAALPWIPITVLPGSATKLEWSAPYSVTVGQCAPVDLLVTDNTGNRVSDSTVTGSASISISGGAGGGGSPGAYANSSCTTSLSNLTISGQETGSSPAAPANRFYINLPNQAYTSFTLGGSVGLTIPGALTYPATQILAANEISKLVLSTPENLTGDESVPFLFHSSEPVQLNIAFKQTDGTPATSIPNPFTIRIKTGSNSFAQLYQPTAGVCEQPNTALPSSLTYTSYTADSVTICVPSFGPQAALKAWSIQLIQGNVGGQIQAQQNLWFTAQ